ncbi:hypothetical protein OPV22_001926 [Ensete ventricosum]|uniref:Uncharacterized protein n=1 Tax=Ensete ventricosum TaxID=4639 RepID=A0AAV8RWL2_ENSVE|nr:hypothetical protein OPV22_001926 [Ensete ventricosum]
MNEKKIEKGDHIATEGQGFCGLILVMQSEISCWLKLKDGTQEHDICTDPLFASSWGRSSPISPALPSPVCHQRAAVCLLWIIDGFYKIRANSLYMEPQQ